MSIIVVSSIALAIALGYFTRINIGLFAIAFAYLIGCFAMDLSTSAVIAMWPLRLFFVIFSVCLFYSFAMTNGTLEKLAEHLLYRCRRVPALLPFAIFLTATAIAAMGAGYYTVLAFMAPITLILCQRTGLGLITGGLAVNYGALAGANFASSQSGIIFRGLMTTAGVPEGEAFLNALGIFAATFVVPVVVLTILTLIGRRSGNALNAIEAERPGPFSPIQRKTLWLTLVMMAVVLAPPLAQLALPGNETVAFVNGKIDIGLIASVFSVIALLMKLGDERKAFAAVPWSTLIMICGVGMLVSLAVAAGTIDALAAWMGTSIPAALVPVVLGVIAAIMSLFSSTLGVVTPALFPLVPSLADTLSLNPAILFIAIVVGAQATSISPFSSGGSLILGSAPDEEMRRSLFPRLLFRAAPIGFFAALAMNIVLTVLA
ncbi:SLC13 family permease [Aureimonas mangrovi]|uniref:SLC13 family permease n=1 Tax=Aureimonas mangrovi TaxID=2758041 RepID=UPI00163D66D2|nr:SLC13 family permease [Aureimonas mangrovi]